MSTRREAHYADAGDAVCGGILLLHIAHRLGCILKWHFGVVVRHSVHQHRRRNAILGQPLAKVVTLVTDCHQPVAAAGANDDALSRCLLFVRLIDVEHRLGCVRVTHPALVLLATREVVGVWRGGVVPQLDGKVLCLHSYCHKRKYNR